MMINAPMPAPAAAAPAPATTTPPAATALPKPPAGAPPTDDAPAQPGGTSTPGEGPPIPTKEQAIRETMSMSAQDAAAAVASNFETLGKLTVGGGTKEGVEHAKLASMLLMNSSNMLQLAHLKASEHLRSLADELDMQMMSSATNLAFVGGQVALAGGSAQPVKVAEIAAEPIARSTAALAGVLAVLAPATTTAPDAPELNPASTGEPEAPAPAPAPTAAPDSSPTPPAAPAPAASFGDAAAAPKGLQHVTPGPGAGPGPNPA